MTSSRTLGGSVYHDAYTGFDELEEEKNLELAVKGQIGPKLVYQEGEKTQPNSSAAAGKDSSGSAGKLINDDRSSPSNTAAQNRIVNANSVQTSHDHKKPESITAMSKPDYNVMSLPEVGQKPGRNGKVPVAPAQDQNCCSCKCTIF